MKALDVDARRRGLLFLNECGLDPGIDHLSAMQVIDRIRRGGGSIISFESFTGGLIAPDTDPGNPWRYKFTWNPRNVVLAGQGTAKYLYRGKDKYIPYQQLFQRLTPIEVSGYGPYEGYANRDSLKYITTYGLTGIQTMLRGTLRNKGFCNAWNIFVQLGCCDDTYPMEDVGNLTHAGFIDCFLPPSSGNVTVQEKLSSWLRLSTGCSEISMLQWSGFFDETPVGLQSGTPANILEHILNKKWKLQEGDIDQIIMSHRFVYTAEGNQNEIHASLIATGTDERYTAMAKTVGWPLAIATKLLAFNKIKARGVVIPTTPEFYEPILVELASLGIGFIEIEVG
jgi:saccharopine dehydrogenase (NADP+, L-glutamate forming)